MKPTNPINNILDILDETGIEIVSYGLAPNPNGFCFETPEDWQNKGAVIVLSSYLDSLTAKQEQELKTIVFG